MARNKPSYISVHVIEAVTRDLDWPSSRLRAFAVMTNAFRLGGERMAIIFCEMLRRQLQLMMHRKEIRYGADSGDDRRLHYHLLWFRKRAANPLKALHYHQIQKSPEKKQSSFSNQSKVKVSFSKDLRRQQMDIEPSCYKCRINCSQNILLR